MSEENFVQFPLCALAIKQTVYDITNQILSYGIVSAGAAALEKLNRDQRREKCDGFGLAYKCADSFELAAHLGAKACNLTLPNALGCVARHNTVFNHASAWQKKYGKSPLVRVRNNMVLEVRDGGQMSWREFRVLVGIYSIIGAKTFPVVIPLSMIEARHCGFSNQATLRAGVAAEDCPERLTIKQLRVTVEKLWQLGWFARVTPDPHGRKTYYSHRMSADEMRERLFKTRTFKPTFVAAERAKNQELADKIKCAKGTFNSNDHDEAF